MPPQQVRPIVISGVLISNLGSYIVPTHPHLPAMPVHLVPVVLGQDLLAAIRLYYIVIHGSITQEKIKDALVVKVPKIILGALAVVQ